MEGWGVVVSQRGSSIVAWRSGNHGVHASRVKLYMRNNLDLYFQETRTFGAAMDKYKEYLAANVLNEGKIVSFLLTSIQSLANVYQVSYRTLSIALKVHVNLAKQSVVFPP